MIKTTLKLEGLNAVRFFAFLWVFCMHTLPKDTGSGNFFFRFFTFINSHGYLGVNLFFVLSSFLLTYLGLVEKKETHFFSVKNFLIRRSLRIFPLYYLIIIFSFLLLPLFARIASVSITLPGNVWGFIFFLSNYDHNDFIFGLKFLWSIAVEEQYYWTWALLLLFFRRNFIVVTTLLFSVYCLLFFILSPLDIQISIDSFAYLSNFSIGGLFAILFFYFRQRVKLLALSTVWLIIFGSGWFFLSDGPYHLLQLIISLFFGSILVFSIALCELSFIKQNSVYRFFDKLGIYTYGLYVYSGFVITFVNFMETRYKIPLNRFFIFLLELGIVTIIARMSYRFYEVKLLNFGNKFRWRSKEVQ